MLTFLVIITSKLNITEIHSFLFDTQDVVKLGRPTLNTLHFSFISSLNWCNLISIVPFFIVYQFSNAFPPKDLKHKNRTEKKSHVTTDCFLNTKFIFGDRWIFNQKSFIFLSFLPPTQLALVIEYFSEFGFWKKVKLDLGPFSIYCLWEMKVDILVRSVNCLQRNFKRIVNPPI